MVVGRMVVGCGICDFTIYDCIGPFGHCFICGRVALVATINRGMLFREGRARPLAALRVRFAQATRRLRRGRILRVRRPHCRKWINLHIPKCNRKS